MLFQNTMKLLQKYGINFLNGLGTTLLLALISVAIGCVIGFGANAAAHSASDSNSVSGNKTTPGSAGSRAESPNTPPSTEASKSLFPVSGSRKKRRTALSKSASM